MNSIRYIITRFCLQDGSMRLLKYNESYFPEAGPIQFTDDSGHEYIAQVDRSTMCVHKLDGMYHDLNLGVNDVLIITPLEAGRYQVKAMVKPLPPTKKQKQDIKTKKGGNYTQPAPRPVLETKRVVVSSSPHVKEVRIQTTNPASLSSESDSKELHREKQEDPAVSIGSTSTKPSSYANESKDQSIGRHVQPTSLDSASKETEPASTKSSFFSKPLWSGKKKEEAHKLSQLEIEQRNEQEMQALAHQSLTRSTTVSSPPLPISSTIPNQLEDQVCELARLSGYRTEFVGKNLIRLFADLGSKYGYTVLVALDANARTEKVWQEQRDDHHVQVTSEAERLPDVARLTQEALVALIEHARLTPLSPMDLRGYWRAGNLDLESAASIAELVSAHLAQRGAFSYVLLTLAQQPAHSVVSSSRLAERLGSSVSTAELNAILDTLSRPPFLALTPMHGGQYLMRASVPELLSDIIEYAQTIRSRLNQKGQDSGQLQQSVRQLNPAKSNTSQSHKSTSNAIQPKRTVTV